MVIPVQLPAVLSLPFHCCRTSLYRVHFTLKSPG